MWVGDVGVYPYVVYMYTLVCGLHWLCVRVCVCACVGVVDNDCLKCSMCHMLMYEWTSHLLTSSAQ